MSTLYNNLVVAFQNGLSDNHQVIQAKDNLFKCYVPENRKKSKDDLPFVEIIRLLQKETWSIPKSRAENETLCGIIRYMRDRKITHVGTGCIRNFFSRLQNLLRGCGFKTSVEMANDFMGILEKRVAEPKNIGEFLNLLKPGTIIDDKYIDDARSKNNLNIRCSEGGNLLHELCGFPFKTDPVWVTYFVKLGGNINQKNLHKYTPIYELIDNYRPPEAEREKYDLNFYNILKALIDNKADLDLSESDSNTPLMYALSKKMPLNIIEILAKNTKKIDVKNKDGLNALHIAANENYGPAIQVLVAAGANPLVRDSLTGSVPLKLAFAKAMPLEFLKPILSETALKIPDKLGTTAEYLLENVIYSTATGEKEYTEEERVAIKAELAKSKKPAAPI